MAMYSFGNGANGRLGLGNTRDQWEPKIVSKFNTLAPATTKSIRVFPSFSKFLSGGNRQNKDSTEGDIMAESLVLKKRTGIISDQIACGLRHSAIVERDTGHVYAFGYGGNGELGQGPTLVDLHIPTILHPEFTSKWRCVTLACGGQHNLAICQPTLGEDSYRFEGAAETNRENHRQVLFAWGRGLEGQLGIGGISSSVPRSVPLKQHKTSDAIVSVACGEYHSVVMTRDGLVYTFGQNMCGNLGLGHYRDSKHPSLMNIKKFKRKAVVAVKCSTSFTLFLCNDTPQGGPSKEAANEKFTGSEKSSNNEIAGAIKKNADEASEELQTNTSCDDRDNINIPKHGSDSNAGGVIDNVDDIGSDQKEVEKHFQVWEKRYCHSGSTQSNPILAI